jgi:hypothetical protein
MRKKKLIVAIRGSSRDENDESLNGRPDRRLIERSRNPIERPKIKPITTTTWIVW